MILKKKVIHNSQFDVSIFILEIDRIVHKPNLSKYIVLNNSLQILEQVIQFKTFNRLLLGSIFKTA